MEQIQSTLAGTLLRQGAKHVELEFRLGAKTPEGFRPGVTPDAFLKLRRHLGVPVEESTTTDVAWAGFRDTGGAVISKSRLAHLDVGIKGLPVHVRASVALEVPVENPPPRDGTEFTRRKQRWSYARGPWRIDLTCVDARAYEVEVELADPDEFLRTSLDELIHAGMKIAAELAGVVVS